MRNMIKTLKVVCVLAGLAVALVPSWLFLLLYRFVNPVSFWERFATIGGGLVVFGSIQVGMLVVWGLLSAAFLSITSGVKKIW